MNNRNFETDSFDGQGIPDEAEIVDMVAEAMAALRPVPESYKIKLDGNDRLRRSRLQY